MDTADPRVDTMIEPGKVFVGGLSWETTDDSFKNHFEKFGEIADTKIMRDPFTGKPRGFGFVTYTDPSSVPKVLSEKEHSLDGKKIDPKPATNNKDLQTKSSECKVFLGGLPFNCAEEDIKASCSEYGKVVNVDIKGTEGKPRGFAFVDFENAKCAKAIVDKHYILVTDKKVEVKAAQPRPQVRAQGQQQQQQQQQATLQQSYTPNYVFSMGRGGMSGATANPYYAAAQYQYAAGAAYGQQYHPAAQYDFRNQQFAGQQVTMSSYTDTNSGGYSQPRSSYGTNTSEQYNGGGGATNYSGYEHLNYSSYPGDQTGTMSYTDHSGAATTQQRSGYSYGRS